MRNKTHFMSRGVIATAGLLAFALAAPQAHAENELEIGGFLGLHAFSSNNEIGVADLPGGDGAQDALSPNNSAIIGLRIAYNLNPMFAIEGELGFIPAKVGGDEITAEILSLVYRIQALAHLSSRDKKIRPFALLGVGGMSISSSEPDTIYNDDDFVFHAGAGLKYRMKDSWGLRLDVRALFPPSSASESITIDVEALVGLYFNYPSKSVPPPPKDTDEDGMTDDIDQCITEAEDKDEFQDDDGCPDADNDQDGILDAADKCPNKPEDKDGFEDNDGCAEDDNDKDGVLDGADKCPLKPEDKDGFEDEDGCPEDDNDGDGIKDANDQCPMKAEDKDGFQDEDGCPDPDNDGDGVLDAADKCPDQMETKNGFQDADGCADEIPKKLKRFTGTVKGIRFATGKTTIRAVSNRTLNAAVKVLKEYPDLRIEISGHTDNVGKAEDNRALSLGRATSVKEYMVSKGIVADRIEVKGFGPDRPVADNAKKAGRAQNRRVEFKLLSQLTAAPPAPAPAPAPEPAPAPAPQ